MVYIEQIRHSRVDTDELGLIGALRPLELPTWRLREAELAEVVMAVGRRPDLWKDLVQFNLRGRWWMSLFSTDNFEVTLQTWAHEEASDWHDHGGSSGAFAVTSGALLERFRATDGVTVLERRVSLGKVAAFGPGHVHDVAHVNGVPATSIHAYSPPLTKLTYYERTSLGFVTKEVVSDIHSVAPGSREA